MWVVLALNTLGTTVGTSDTTVSTGGGHQLVPGYQYFPVHSSASARREILLRKLRIFTFSAEHPMCTSSPKYKRRFFAGHSVFSTQSGQEHSSRGIK